jgi:hypothetical protein
MVTAPPSPADAPDTASSNSDATIVLLMTIPLRRHEIAFGPGLPGYATPHAAVPAASHGP